MKSRIKKYHKELKKSGSLSYLAKRLHQNDVISTLSHFSMCHGVYFFWIFYLNWSNTWFVLALLKSKQLQNDLPVMDQVILEQLVTNELSGFLLLLTTKGKIIFVSHNIEQLLGHYQVWFAPFIQITLNLFQGLNELSLISPTVNFTFLNQFNIRALKIKVSTLNKLVGVFYKLFW